MGYALAAAAARRGANVTLISGPTALPCPTGVTRLDITSAADMLAASLAHPGDVFIAAAAVADYRVAQPAAHKQKKQGDSGLTLQLVQNPDIVATIAALRENRPYTVGFAAETDNVLAYATNAHAKTWTSSLPTTSAGTSSAPTTTQPPSSLPTAKPPCRARRKPRWRTACSPTSSAIGKKHEHP